MRVFFCKKVSKYAFHPVIIVNPMVELLEHWRQAKSPPEIGKSKSRRRERERKWFVFYHGKRELGACTVRGSFPGEIEATVELLAGENNIPQEAIRVAVEKR